MKSLFTLLLTCMISLSLMGQQDIKELKKQRYAKKHHHSFTALEKKMSRSPEYASRHLSRQFSAIQRTSLKAGQATDQTMDSILWELYDTNNSQWSLSDRELFSYNGNGDMTHYVWFAFDSVEMKILPFNKEQLQYNAQGPYMFYLYEWDKSSGQWVYTERFELTYDGAGNLSQEMVYEWDTDANQWLVAAQFDMTYDDEGNILTDTWLFWDKDSSKLILTFKDEYIYEGGKLTTWNEYMWDEGDWVLTFITTNTYAGENLIEELTQGWDYLSEDWGDYSKYEYTYEGDKVVTEEVWGFDWMQLMMVKQSLYEYTWDGDGNMTTEVKSSWDEGSGQYVQVWKSEWTFNKDFTIFNLYVPYWFLVDVTDLTFVHMPVSELGYYNNNGTWDLNYRQTAYYSDFGGSSGIEDAYESPVSVFPNPASESVTFSWDGKYNHLDLELFDLTGKRIISRSIDNNETIRVDQLSRGVYLYKLMDKNDLIHIGKISLR